MKNVRRILSAILVVSLIVVAFAACTGGNKGNETNADEILIGGIGPTTGGASIYGTAVRNGAQLAVDEINAAGGVNGLKLKLDFQDDENNAVKANSAYNTLMDRKMQILLGTVTSKPCEVIVNESYKDKVFQITPSATSIGSLIPEVGRADRSLLEYQNSYRVCFNDPEQGAKVAEYIADKMNLKKVAIIYNNSDTYSTGITNRFKEVAKEKGLEIVAEESFASDDVTDFRVQLQTISTKNADIVFLPIYYQPASAILKQNPMKDMKFIGCDGLDGIISQLGADAKLAESVLLTTPFNPYSANEKVQKFVEAYKKAYNNEMPIQFAANAYDAVYIIKQALEKADVKDAKIKYNELADKLMTSILEIQFDGVTGAITWSKEGEPNKDAKFVRVEDGKYVDIN